MTEGEVHGQLARVFDAYPSYRRFLRQLGEDDAGQSLGNRTIDAWAKMLTGCDSGDVVHVVDEIVSGDREPTTQYQSQDMLVKNIREAANDRRSKRTERARMETKYLSSEGMSALRSNDRRFGFASHEAVRCGELVKAGKLSREENARRVGLLIDFMNGRVEQLDWIGASE